MEKIMNKIITKMLGVTLLIASSTVVSSPLVDVQWIKDNSCNSDVRVLDIRGNAKTAYLKGHIPCAVYTNYSKVWRTKVKGVIGQLPPTDQMSALIGKLGIDNDTHVVIYTHGSNSSDLGSATRTYFTFKVLGHDNVSILNGGLKAYLSDKTNKVEKGNNSVQAKVFNASKRENMLSDAEEVLSAIDNKDIEIVDLRTVAQYLGVNRHGKSKRSGTIPGSINFPQDWTTINGGGTFRSKSELEALYKFANVENSGDQINFCNTGHWASLGWFVSSEIMGNDKATLYDGSMVEWTANPSLPMEKSIDGDNL
jgi:thiosulfate/3-mercaptopyruvate sulfurtransferase